MPVKMSGTEYREFIVSKWGPDAYWEEAVISVDGDEVPEDADEMDLIKDASIVTITGGTIIPDQSKELALQETICAEKFARAWLKERSMASIVLDVPKDDLAALLADLKARWPKVKVPKK